MRDQLTGVRGGDEGHAEVSHPVPESPQDDEAPESSRDDSEPVSSRRAVAVVPVPADSGPRLGNMREALRRFVSRAEKGEGRDFVRSVVVRKLYGSSAKKGQIDEELVGEIVSMAVLRALDTKTLPLTTAGIRGWIWRLTRCAVADYFEDRKGDKKYLDRGADPVNWADRHQPGTDWGAREHLIVKWLEQQIGDDPVRKETLRLMMEHNVAGKSLEELARENRTTEQALASRFHKLRKELGPKVSIMDRERPRRAILLLLFFGALAVIGIILFALWRTVAPVPPPQLPIPRPIPSASARPAPTFDQALPPRNDLAPPNPLDDKSPRGGK
jgi:hypothetical protein